MLGQIPRQQQKIQRQLHQMLQNLFQSRDAHLYQVKSAGVIPKGGREGDVGIAHHSKADLH
ncbi:hypothetical protein NW838_02750 [Synechococcus sp. R55.2]